VERCCRSRHNRRASIRRTQCILNCISHGVFCHALVHAFMLLLNIRNGDRGRSLAESSGVNRRFARRASGIAVLLAISAKSAKVKSDFSSSDASSARYPSGYIRGSPGHAYFQSCGPPGFTSARARERASFATRAHFVRRDTVDPAPTRMPAASIGLELETWEERSKRTKRTKPVSLPVKVSAFGLHPFSIFGRIHCRARGSTRLFYSLLFLSSSFFLSFFFTFRPW
jgi:hypothetical protein